MPDTLIFLIIIGVIVGVTIRSQRRRNSASAYRLSSHSGDVDSGLGDVREELNESKPATLPPNTTILSGRGRLGIVGEPYYTDNIERVCGKRYPGVVGNWDSGLFEMAFLIREPSNRHDKNAIVVKMPAEGRLLTVGYIARDKTREWHPLLAICEAQNGVPTCKGFIYLSANGRDYQIVLRVSDPGHALISNSPPDDAIILDPTRQAALIGEKGFQETLEPLAGETVWATLHRSAFESGTHKGEMAIEVRVDGKPVGTLSAKQSARYDPLLEAGDVVACELDAFSGKTGVEAQIYLPRVD